MGRYEWYFKGTLLKSIDFTDKEQGVAQYVMYMLNRTQSMFKYTGLPDTLPQRDLELILQTQGFAVIPVPSKVAGVKGDIYAFGEGASLGGERNVYYMPTICNISSPALNWSDSLKIGEECVVIPNDSLYMGLLPLFSRYATMLTENDLSMWIADINLRIIDLISAPDDNTLKSAKGFLDDIKSGKLGVISNSAFLEGLKATPYNSGDSHIMTQLIELQQYLKAGWYNDIGLNANYNMKRESITSNEAQLNDDALLPLIDNMLEMRQKGFDLVNKLCGTNIKVELNSSWQVRKAEEERTLEQVENGDEVEPDEQITIEEVDDSVETD